jgi:GT2 family glycosyltransferase
MEVIVADNASPDGSGELARQLLSDWSNGCYLPHGANLGFCEGNNRPAIRARGRYLFFLNNDTWLEPDCLEILLTAVQRTGAAAGTPRVLTYDGDGEQVVFGAGFDLFGLVSFAPARGKVREIFMPPGCCYLIDAALFSQLGGFDPEFFMYADDLDLSWRLWAAGRRAIGVPAARLHHRMAANANPAGGGQIVEFRTSASTRYYSHRNCLLAVLKNAQHVLLLLAATQVALLLLEGVVALLLTRSWGLVRRAYVEALVDCWRLRRHIGAERRRLRQLRQRSDWWLLRFLRLRLNRWDEILRIRRLGLPKFSR